MNNKILVTGASGFIGRYYMSLLEDKPVKIIAASRTRPEYVPTNGTWLASPELAEGSCWQAHLDGVQTLVHLAGRAHVVREPSVNAVDEFRKINTEGTVELAKQALKAGVQRFIFVSSIGVHGIETRVPLKPGSPVAPLDDYAVSKQEAEKLLRDVFFDSNVELVIVRPPMVYGIDAPGNFRRLLDMVTKGVPLPFGLVQNRRSLVSVHNLSEILWRAASYPLPSCCIILPCDGEVVSTAEIIRGMAKALGVSPRLLPVPVALMYAAATLLGRRRTAVKVLGDFEIDPQPLYELLGWRGKANFVDELKRGVVRSVLK
ncbi:NAD-dependent epimerase/dehydratase family protein [Halopseudomonas xiamenensis]|uniref:NAD-dependent epimerase/dehydratase family protein n=1 Tax=Halopseudomonas xiamenensis TaxID=157792 RepID=UPI001628B562|nr:NAD-dependent epimerase/dehydratase family protein [Halopseudomonas xiamenensis]